MRLFLPMPTTLGLNFLRCPLRYDLMRKLSPKATATCYTDEAFALAQAKAIREGKQEMCLVVIEADEDYLKSLWREDLIQRKDDTVLLSCNAQESMVKNCRFSLSIVKGTEDYLATYDRVPECGAGWGPVH